ncbi:MAG: AIR synthase-related protein, partial [Candidatus Cloacimonadaceae bacterium]|nr:AIR synthase-related protein [Candidatus Cloacimonadaceae bacterium]
MLGLMEDYSKAVTQYFKSEADHIILLGKEADEIGGSEYLKQIFDIISGNPPLVDLDLELKLQKLIIELIELGMVQSAHDCSDGGLLVCVAESCFNPSNIWGVELNFAIKGIKSAAYFGESHGRIVISVKPENVPETLKIIKSHDYPYLELGRVFARKS